MPHEVTDRNGNITSYMHVGQHSAADYHHCVSISKLATEAEYADLKQELENVGYDVRVVSKQNRSKYLLSYKEIRKN